MNKLYGACLIIGMVFLFLIQLGAAGAARAGKYDNGDFSMPDYGNGATETVSVGDGRTFNYNCHCADQPGTTPCRGNIRLQVNSGGGFSNEKSDACNVNELQSCTASYAKTFSAPGVYAFRIFCDESTGTDFTQPSNEYVTVTVLEGCTDGETMACALQSGVCQGSYETCTAGAWPGCDYDAIQGYEDTEATCDSLDNDCNGYVDDADLDADGSSPCGGMGTANEVVVSGLGGSPGSISVFEYRHNVSAYVPVWTTTYSGFTGGSTGGEIGDVNNDGVNDFVLIRGNGTNYADVWTYNASSKNWYLLWRGAFGSNYPYMGDIADFDDDGLNEMVLTNYAQKRVEIWGNKTAGAKSLGLLATVVSCASEGINYIKSAGDLNGNGVPEIFAQCGTASTAGPLRVFEWNGASYAWIANVSLPAPYTGTGTMLVDDIECNGDLNRDGINDCVLCGNSGTSHVLSYQGGAYSIAYSAPGTNPFSPISFAQTCSIGDLDNDGYADWLDSSAGGGLRVFSFKNGAYGQVWNYANHGVNPPIGGSFAGDSDNDNKGEFLVVRADTGEYQVELWESDSVGATSLANTFNFGSSTYSANVMIGNLNPNNDDRGVDCNDGNASIYPGAVEICGDGIDNNCNDQIDEGCGLAPPSAPAASICGDGYCDGLAAGENCNVCPDDCWSGPRGACCGDGSCDLKKGEDASVCSVDCL
jgi:hypothetical protein